MTNFAARAIFQIRKMNNIRRSNDMPVKDYNVAQHSYNVTMLAMFIAKDLKESGAIAGYDEALLLRKALMHDVGEVVTGDILYPVKKKINTLVDTMEREGLYSIFANTPFADYVNDAISCKHGLEGEIVDLADMLEYVLNMYEEVTRGNRFMRSRYEYALDLLTKMKWFEESEFVFHLVQAMEECYSEIDNLV